MKSFNLSYKNLENVLEDSLVSYIHYPCFKAFHGHAPSIGMGCSLSRLHIVNIPIMHT